MPSCTADPQISQDQWDWVRDLIRDVEREEKRDEFMGHLYQWDMAVRQFRKTEEARMILGTPTERDLNCHAICLHALLAMGHSLVLRIHSFREDEFQKWNVKREHVGCYVEELEQSLREWHHGFTDSEVKAAQDRIFGVAS